MVGIRGGDLQSGSAVGCGPQLRPEAGVSSLRSGENEQRRNETKRVGTGQANASVFWVKCLGRVVRGGGMGR